MPATAATLGLSCHVGLCCTTWPSQLDRTVGSSFGSFHDALWRGLSDQVQLRVPSSWVLCPKSWCLHHGALCLWGTTAVANVLEISQTTLTNNSKDDFSCVGNFLNYDYKHIFSRNNKNEFVM